MKQRQFDKKDEKNDNKTKKRSENGMKPTSIRLNEETYKKVKTEADEQKRSISKQIEYIIEKYYKIREETSPK